MTVLNEEIQDQVQGNTDKLKVLITSDQPMGELEAKLGNLEVDIRWQQIAEPLSGLEDTFTFRHLKPAFETSDNADRDLVIAVDSTHDKFTLGVRKIQDGKFILFNIHHTALVLSKLLLESHGVSNFKKSIFISDLLDKLFAKYRIPVTTIGNLPSPIRAQEAYHSSESGETLFITENQEILLKGQTDSLGYLLSQIVLEAKKTKTENKTLFDSLIAIYNEFGFQREKNLVVSIEEPSQKVFYKKIIAKLKKKPPLNLGMIEIISIEDLSNGTTRNMLSGRVVPSQSPSANALQILLGNNSKVLIFPSEQKINFFFTTQGKLIRRDDFNTLNIQFDQRVVKLLSEINRLGQEA